MDSSEYKNIISADSNMAQGFPTMFTDTTAEPQVVETVGEMLAATQPVHDINQVEIDVVPDFSGLMKTMMNKGQI